MFFPARMRKVVDCSALESPTLLAFLDESRRNCAVLTDVANHEVFAIGTRAGELLNPFATHAGQAILLHPTWQIWKLRPRRNGFIPRFIDQKQTRLFSQYCRMLASGHPRALANAERKARESQDFGMKLLGDAEPLLRQMQRQIASYDSRDLKALRSGHSLSPQFCAKITRDVAENTARDLREAQGTNASSSAQEIKASLIFRLNVCSYALTVRRAADGGVEKLGTETYRNDLNDCIYAAYATLFDGLVSCDDGLVKTYNLSLILLRDAFDCRNITAEEATLAVPKRKAG
jgi:hypothetical protein